MMFLTGAGAGLVSALLFGVVATLSPLALLLSYLAPLPVLIAALGWNHRAGLIATAVGSVACGLLLTVPSAVVFGVAVGLPAWWLAYLTLLARPDEQGKPEWYPLGRLLVWTAVVSSLITIIGAMALGPSYDDYRASLEEVIRTMAGMGAAGGEAGQAVGADADEFVKLVSAAVPAVAAITFVFMMSFNLWLAGRTVLISGRLPRPWPSIPDTLMPRVTIPVFWAALLLGLVGDGWLGLAGLTVAGGLVAAFSLQGLAAIHAATRGRPARGLLLAVLYMSLLILSVWVLMIVAVFGMAVVMMRKQNAEAALPPR